MQGASSAYLAERGGNGADAPPLLDAVPIGVQKLDAQARIVWANRALLALLGYELHHLAGRPAADLHADPVAERELADELARGQVLRDRPATLRHRDGSVRHVLVSCAATPDDGGPPHAYCFVQDVTERTRLERRLAAENGVGRALAEATCLREAAPRVLEAVCRTTGWSWGALWVLDADDDGPGPGASPHGDGDGRDDGDGSAEPTLRCAEFWRHPDRPLPEFEAATRALRLRRGVGLPGRVWATARPAWVDDLAAGADLPRGGCAAGRQGVHGALAFPVPARDGGVLGVMEFFSRHPRQPDADLLDVMRAIGTQLGRYVERCRGEQALAGSLARNRTVVEAALDAVATIDQRGRVLEWNPAAERMFGHSRGEAVGHDIFELIAPARLRDQHRLALARDLVTGVSPMVGQRVETFAVRRDGEEFPVELAMVRVSGVGPPTFTGFVRDLSERRRADETFASLRAVLQELLVARDIQQGVLPKRFPPLPGVEVAGMVRAAAQCSGDFYDYLTAADGRPVIALGDAAGHGLGPALVAVETATCLRALARTYARVEHLLTEANAILADVTPPAAFVTMILVGIDPETRSLTFANAGHPPGLVVGRDGRVRAELASTDLPLAVSPDVAYEQGDSVPLEPGDLVVLVSDGLLEAWSAAGEAFGRARLREAACGLHRDSAASAVERLYDAVRAFARWEPQHDDMTVVAIKVAAE